MTYRPTVRYSEIFRTYVNDVFHATTLDRNQIIRAALFSAALSPQFNQLLEKYRKPGVQLPSPKWNASQNSYWKEKNPEILEGGKDTNVIDIRKRTAEETPGVDSIRGTTIKTFTDRCKPSTPRREREVSAQRIIFNDKKGITIRIGEA